MIGPAEKARRYMIDGDNSNNSREKVLHFVNAAKEYAKAVDTVTDPVVKASLAYLSVSASQKAQLVQSIIQQYSSDHVLQLEQANRAMGKAKPFGPISEVSDNVHDNRLIFKAYQSRLAGINKVPKFTPPSDATAVKDLLTLEARLNELGLRRNGTDSLTSVPHRSIKISSELGESFMVLKPPGSTALAASTASVAPSEAMTPVLERRPSLNANASDDTTTGYGGGNAVKIRNLVTSPSSGSSTPASSSSGSTASTLTAPLAWATTVMNWGGFAAASTPSSVPPEGNTNKTNNNNWTEDDFEESSLNWNEQSLFNPGAINPSADPYGRPSSKATPMSAAAAISTKKSTPDKIQQLQQQQQPQPSPLSTQEQRHFYDVMAQSTSTAMSASTASAYPQHLTHRSGDELTRSTINTINSAAKDNNEGVVNLLNSIQRLGEENAALVARIDQLTKVEEENKKILTDMEVFKMDYEDKFKRVKKVLKEYAARYPQGSNPVSEAFEAVAQQQQQQLEQRQVDEKETAKALASMAVGGSSQDKQQAPDRAAEEKRMKDLERTVNALVSRLQHANDEIKRRDGMLRGFDPQYVSTIQPPTKHSSRPPSGGIPQAPSAGGSSGGSRTSSSGAGGSNTMRAGMAAGTLSPLPPKKQITAPVARHSSTATLESLQQKKNAS